MARTLGAMRAEHRVRRTCVALREYVGSGGRGLESGRVTLSDRASALLHDPHVRQAYLGGD